MGIYELLYFVLDAFRPPVLPFILQPGPWHRPPRTASLKPSPVLIILLIYDL